MTKWLQRVCDNIKQLQNLTFQQKHRLRKRQGEPLAEKVVTIPKGRLCHHAHCSRLIVFCLIKLTVFVFCTLYNSDITGPLFLSITALEIQFGAHCRRQTNTDCPLLGRKPPLNLRFLISDSPARPCTRTKCSRGVKDCLSRDI